MEDEVPLHVIEAQMEVFLLSIKAVSERKELKS
jgi:hypothetical protein